MPESSTATGGPTGPRITAPLVQAARTRRPTDSRPFQAVFEVNSLDFYYGSFRALRGVTLQIGFRQVTAFIGPSGCGKSTFLRCLNRMNDLIPGARIDGAITYRGLDLYGPGVDDTEVRRRIGMVFQRPNPFPRSIFDNVAFGPRINRVPRSQIPELVESSLRSAALWDEVKDKVNDSALALSGGQQQRLCIARAIANKPDVILMDEPCSALDPIATLRIEELIDQLRNDYTIVIVTHNMQQAARVSDRTAFFTVDEDEPGGVLVEIGNTDDIFTTPSGRTADYISGRFG